MSVSPVTPAFLPVFFDGTDRNVCVTGDTGIPAGAIHTDGNKSFLLRPLESSPGALETLVNVFR